MRSFLFHEFRLSGMTEIAVTECIAKIESVSVACDVRCAQREGRRTGCRRCPANDQIYFFSFSM